MMDKTQGQTWDNCKQNSIRGPSPDAEKGENRGDNRNREMGE